MGTSHFDRFGSAATSVAARSKCSAADAQRLAWASREATRYDPYQSSSLPAARLMIFSAMAGRSHSRSRRYRPARFWTSSRHASRGRWRASSTASRHSPSDSSMRPRSRSRSARAARSSTRRVPVSPAAVPATGAASSRPSARRKAASDFSISPFTHASKADSCSPLGDSPSSGSSSVRRAVASGRLVARQMSSRASQPQPASVSPSGAKARRLISRSLGNASRSWPVSGSQNRTVWSSLAEAIVLPSLEKARPRTGPA